MSSRLMQLAATISYTHALLQRSAEMAALRSANSIGSSPPGTIPPPHTHTHAHAPFLRKLKTHV